MQLETINCMIISTYFFLRLTLNCYRFEDDENKSGKTREKIWRVKGIFVLLQHYLSAHTS